MVFGSSPEREAIRALIPKTQREITGLVRLRFYRGNIVVAGRKRSKRCCWFHPSQCIAIEIARHLKVGAIDLNRPVLRNVAFALDVPGVKIG